MGWLFLLPWLLVVESMGVPQLTVTWDAYTSPMATGLRLERSSDGGQTWTRVTVVSPATRRVSDPAVQVGVHYWYRLIAEGDGMADSRPSTVIDMVCCALPGLTLGASTALPGDSLPVSFAAIPSPGPMNFLTLTMPGRADRDYVRYQRTGGVASGTVAFAIPSPLAQGTYEFRLYADDTYLLLAVSAPFVVEAPPLPPLTGLTIRWVP